ncbi:hypothetical protein [Streptomyces sp. NPDC060027]|uniref:hypothetical protein n=1 Tax=Streptomyces sp. NPDC060027 TaxID=3347040 RepID=UPI0036CD2195
MTVIVLLGVLLLVVAGCVCVYRDARGGAPRWVHVVAVVTIAAGEVLSSSSKRGRSSGGGGGGGDDD